MRKLKQIFIYGVSGLLLVALTVINFQVVAGDFTVGSSPFFKIASFIQPAKANVGSDLQCTDITSCQSSASCGGSGTVTECVLSCANGATIWCPHDDSNPKVN